MKGLDIGSDRVDELAAISAILLYGRQDRSAVYGTVHPVMQGKSGRATIGAGRPIDRMALVDCLRELSGDRAAKCGRPAPRVGVPCSFERVFRVRAAGRQPANA